MVQEAIFKNGTRNDSKATPEEFFKNSIMSRFSIHYGKRFSNYSIGSDCQKTAPDVIVKNHTGSDFQKTVM